jgi:predicted acylesterase/phospholipase RssA
VLDALLASRSVAVEQLGGTSAGTINTAIVASALANGSRVRVRQALQSFWLSIADHVSGIGMAATAAIQRCGQ